MTGSRLAYDHRGRLVCVDAGGHRWLVIGNLLCSTVGGDLVLFGWLGRSGRPATAREQAQARAPYDSNSANRRRAQPVPDDELDEQAALEAARREQEREPADLIGRAA
jgi:hypothetical protein